MSEPDLLDDTPEDDIEQKPLQFLEAVMSGIDPRENSRVWEIVQTIEAENFGDPPTMEQWEGLVSAVEVEYKPRPVDLGTSQRAAITLAEYYHPKRKSVEVSQSGEAVQTPELTEQEFELFEEWFNEQF